MSDNSKVKGVYQLDNGYWGYRFTMIVNGKTVSQRRVKDESGNPFKTEKKAEKARLLAMAEEQTKANKPQTKIIQSRNIGISPSPMALPPARRRAEERIDAEETTTRPKPDQVDFRLHLEHR